MPREKVPPIEILKADRSGRDHIDALLDEALTETFPASDSIAVDPPSMPSESKSGDKTPSLAGVLARAILSTRSDAIIEADNQGTIRFWNPGAERIFGFTHAEAVGRSLDIIIPERLRKRHWDGFDRSMQTGKTRYGEGDVLAVPALRKDGSQISIEFTIEILRNDAGSIIGIAAILRDVTKRFEETRALRRQLAARSG